MNFKSFLYLITVLFSITNTVSAQEMLTGLSSNSIVKKESQKWKANPPKNQYPDLKMPLYIDFSSYIGYPDAAVFIDRQGFVNNTYPIFPPTIGCVTLDALNENGEIYAHATSAPFPADTLTSRCIRLDSVFTPLRHTALSDSIYFSFYYQPGGGTYSFPYLQWERIGNQPEQNDYLLLEFGIPSGLFDSMNNPIIEWTEMWRSDTASLDIWLNNDPNRLSYFKQVMIPILNPNYLNAHFQFRFRNYASLENNGVIGWDSNVDQWHIDYIRLNINRRFDDYYPNDIAFVAPTTSFLKKYQAMPWSQFRANEMKSNYQNVFSNLSQTIKNANYQYSVEKNNNTHVYTYNSYNENIKPYFNNGVQSEAPLHTQPIIDFPVVYDNADSATFTITHTYIEDGNSGNIIIANDTFIYEQKFYNYFAYDDGTAEAGYSLYSPLQNPQIYFAMRFVLNQPDTLRAVKFWFNATYNNSNFEPFSLMVWNNQNHRPNEILYEKSAQMPAHDDEYLNFVTYYLDQPIAISDTFYVGFLQNHNVQLNIGFDQNTDSRDHFLFKTSSQWEEPFLKGTPMIRPVIGKYVSEPQQIAQNQTFDFSVYPNPTQTHISIQINDQNTDLNNPYLYCIYNLYGNKLLSGKTQNAQFDVDMSDFAAGLYILQIYNNNKIHSVKILKQ